MYIYDFFEVLLWFSTRGVWKCCGFYGILWIFVMFYEFLWMFYDFFVICVCFCDVSMYFLWFSCELLWIFCRNGYASQLCVCRYASQVVCMDTRPKLCVWIRVPSCVYIRVPTSCTDTRPKLTSRYASRMSYLLRYVTSVHARAHTMYTCIRVPSCVYGYASQVVCMDTRPKLCVWIRVPTLCMDTRPNCEFVWFLCEFYGFLWIFMISMVNSMVFPRILVEFYGFS